MARLTKEELEKISVLVGTDPQQALDQLTASEALHNYPGFLIDIGFDLQRPDLVECGIGLLKKLISTPGNDPSSVHLYNLANGFYSLHMLTHKHGDFSYDPDTSPLIEAKRYYRQALDSTEKSTPLQRSRLRVNYGNCLSTLGRTVEAIDQYDLALVEAPDHAMAWGNLGTELQYFAALARDPSLLYNARDALTIALEGNQLEQTENFSTRSRFMRTLQNVRMKIATQPETPASHTLSSQSGMRYHQAYAEFCQQKHLFLNFCLRSRPCAHATEDTLTFGLITNLEDDTTFVRLSRVVNEMKERYATARLLLYEACSPLLKTQGFDELTVYTDNLDYAVYGIGVGKLKLAFEGAYNILDKIAFFINDYLQLGIGEQTVDFTRLWKVSVKKPVRPEILARNNPHLLGLYDISRDLAAAGYSNNLSQIRNRSSHRYLVPHIEAMDWHEAADDKAYHIGYQELMIRTTELLQLVRSSIIYLTTFIDREEGRKRQGSKMIFPMFAPQYVHYPFGPQESPV